MPPGTAGTTLPKGFCTHASSCHPSCPTLARGTCFYVTSSWGLQLQGTNSPSEDALLSSGTGNSRQPGEGLGCIGAMGAVEGWSGGRCGEAIPSFGP